MRSQRGSLPLLLLLLLILANLCTAYRIVRTGDKSVYLVYRGTCRKIENESTWESLGYSDAKTCVPEGTYGYNEVYSWRTAAGTTPLSGKWVGLAVCIPSISSLDELTGMSKHEKCKLGTPVPVIEKKNNTPDENIRIELLRLQALFQDVVPPHGDLFQDATYLGSYINPTVVPWKENLLLMTGLAFGFGLVDGLAPSETVLFRIVSPRALTNMTIKNSPTEDLPYDVRVVGEYSDKTFSVSGVGQLLQPLNEPFLGQDPRVLQLGPDSLAVVFTNRFTPTITVGLAILAVNNTFRPEYLTDTYPAGDGASASVPTGHMILAGGDNRYFIEASKTPPYRGNGIGAGAGIEDNLVLSHLYPSMHMAGGEGGGEHHKNWSPFVYVERETGTGTRAKPAHKLYFVKHINPLVIITPQWETLDHKTNFLPMKIVSQAPKMNLNFWGYGPIRGGTQALQLQDGRYLAFFHSSCKIGTWHTSYVMGAYTFTGKPPFRILSISALPIMSPLFYQGNWAEFKNRNIDYVVFPMSYFFEDEIGSAFNAASHAYNPATSSSMYSHTHGGGVAGFGHAHLHKKFNVRHTNDYSNSNGNNNNRTIVLSFGSQDRAGWMARIRLNDLLESLINVNNNVTDAGAGEERGRGRGRKLIALDWHRQKQWHKLRHPQQGRQE